jgi:hypothetical protein
MSTPARRRRYRELVRNQRAAVRDTTPATTTEETTMSLTDTLRTLEADCRAVGQDQEADALAEAVAQLERQELADNLADLNDRKSDNGVEWGEYCERQDGDHWISLVYSADDDRELAESWVEPSGAGFRYQRLVCREVGPWKIVEATR